MTEKPLLRKAKTLLIRMTETDLSSVRAAAKQLDLTPSDFARKTLLAAVTNRQRPDDSETLRATQDFRRFFTEVMRLSLTKRLTIERLEQLIRRPE